MFSSGNQLSYLLGISAYVSLYGIACLLVLLIGNSFGFEMSTQIIVIALILLTLPVAILINHFRKKRALKKEAAAEAQAAAGNASEAPVDKAPAAPKRVYDELLRGAEEAVQWLRSSRLGGVKANDAVYALPWFVVAGPSASGKTSLLLSSGLDFHALPSQRRGELKIVRPTRNSEWRMTDSAVWIDTAGRYQSDGLGREEWLALAETIKKHRAHRPLDGLLLVVNADRLLHSSDAEIEQQAKTMRARVDELMHLARVKFPVYLVFTNMDRVPGFKEFFSLNGDDSRAQVWGATIPLEKAANAHALFDAEFDLLRESLMRRRLLRLRKPAAAAAQLRTFVFPLRFSEARDRLGLFSSALFRPNPFSESPLLRGFYFTANLNNSPAQRNIVEDEEAERSAHAVGEPYFTDQLFRDVVLRDKDLAGSFQAAQRRPPRLSVILTAAASVLLLCLIAAGVISFLNNRQLIKDATDRGVSLALIATQDLGKDPLTKDASATRVELEKTESLRETLAQLDEYYQSSPPLYMRFGFYSGNAIKERLRGIYFTSIEQRYVKPTAAKMEADLQSFASGAARNIPISTTSEQATDATNDDFLGRHYDILKAYLMLAQADKVEPTFLANQLQEYWKKSAPSELDNVSQKQLDFYARQAVYDDASRHKADDRLVAEVRQKLIAYPPLKRFYKRVITDINAKTTPVSLDSILQGQNGGVLSSTYTVPGSFTIDGYRNHMLAAFDSAADEISKDDWVMGTLASSGPKNSTDPGTLKTMYLKEYTDQWRRFVRGISVQPFKTSNDAVTALKAFSDSDSPIDRVLETVATNTNLSAKPKSKGFWAWIKSFSSSSATPDAGNETEVEKEFRPVYQYLAFGENKKDDSRMSLYRTELGNLLRSIDRKTPEELAVIQKEVSSGKDEIGLQKADDNIQRSLDNFKTPAAADAAVLLNQPLSALKRFFYGAGYEQIEKEWTEQLYPKAHALESGYPFTQSGQASVNELTEFLNPNNGQLSSFFKARLASSFEGSPGTWKPKRSAPFSFSDDFVKYLNNAGLLSEALFPNNGAQPEVSYGLELQPVPNAVTKITIDGTPVQAQGTSATTVGFTWPAKPGQESGARITVTSGTDVVERPFTGAWGLFQMFDAGSPSPSGEGYSLTWTVGSFTVRATLRPGSPTKSPFNRQLFRDLHAPQKIEK